MSNLNYAGVMAAMATPFTPDDLVDLEAIANQVDYCFGNGVHGIVPGGSTGEFPTLTMQERMEVHEAYIAAAKKYDGLVFAGTGALSTRETVELSKHAEDHGADGVMIVAPFYDGPSFEAVLEHYRAVSRATDLPIMYYNLPSHTGVELSVEQLVHLSQETNIDVIKDTEGDFVKFNTLVADHSDVVTTLCGFDGLNYAALSLGAVGTVWGMAAFAPKLATDFYETLSVNQDLPLAREMWKKILPICDGLESGHYAAGVKAGLDLVGQGAGPVRPPVMPLDVTARENFRQLLEDAGVATVQLTAAHSA